MIIETLSTFPTMYDSVMGSSMMRIAQEKGILLFKAHDLRDWTHDRHRTTDDDPYGGGDGLVMKCPPIYEAFDDITAQTPHFPQTCKADQGGSGQNNNEYALASSLVNSDKGRAVGVEDDSDLQYEMNAGQEFEPALRPTTVFLSPHGKPFTDELACALAGEKRLLFVCGHYEGIDERAYELADRVISLGDYVLTSGELASMVVIDAVVRKLPGVLGADTGALGESFADGLLEYPQYTRPVVFRGMEVPAVLLSGDHGAVARWRRERSLERTALLRPDLLERIDLSSDDRLFLQSMPDEGSLGRTF